MNIVNYQYFGMHKRGSVCAFISYYLSDKGLVFKFVDTNVSYNEGSNVPVVNFPQEVNSSYLKCKLLFEYHRYNILQLRLQSYKYFDIMVSILKADDNGGYVLTLSLPSNIRVDPEIFVRKNYRDDLQDISILCSYGLVYALQTYRRRFNIWEDFLRLLGVGSDGVYVRLVDVSDYVYKIE